MAPAMNHSVAQSALVDTFTMGNVAPQLIGFNQGAWLQLERFALGVSELYEEILILSGPLYLPAEDDSTLISANPQPSRGTVCNDAGALALKPPGVIRYLVLGGEVAVPTHFFKVILARHPRQSSCPGLPHDTAVAAFVLPHSAAAGDLGLHVVSLQQLECAMGGLLFDRALCSLAKARLDEQAAARGLGSGRQAAATRAAKSSLADGAQASVPSLASHLPVERLGLRQQAASGAPPNAERPRPRKRRRRKIDEPESAVALLAEQRHRHNRRDVVSAATVPVAERVEEALAEQLGRLVHLCAVVQCIDPSRLSRSQSSSKALKSRVRWRAPDEDDYDTQWLAEKATRA